MLEGIFERDKDIVYMNAASSGLMSITAKNTIERILKEYTLRGELTWDEQTKIVENFRNQVAKLLNAKSEEVVPIQNTSQGTFIALINVIESQEDEIIVMKESFPSSTYIVEHNFPANKKIYVPFSGRNALDAVKPYITKETRCIVMDMVHFVSGEYWDTEELGEYISERGIYLIVDGIQGIGAIPFYPSIKNVHFLSCGGSKWLLGPGGVGFLWVNSKIFPHLKKVYTGWLGAPWKDFSNFNKLPEPFQNPRMFELGTRNLPGIAGLTENLKIINGIGIEKANSHICQIKVSLIEKLRQLHFKTLHPNSPSGIITVKHPVHDNNTIYSFLKSNNIISSFRNGFIRFSPHIYNNEEDVEKIIKILDKIGFSGIKGL